MVKNYKNHGIHINAIPETEFIALKIFFGEALIHEDEIAETQAKALILAQQIINEFIAELPPALSYKPFKDGDY